MCSISTMLRHNYCERKEDNHFKEKPRKDQAVNWSSYHLPVYEVNSKAEVGIFFLYWV